MASYEAPSGPIWLLSMLKTRKSYLFFRHSASPSEPLLVILFESKKSMWRRTCVLSASPNVETPVSDISFSPRSTV